VAESRAGTTSEGTFGTGANSARIARNPPHEIPAKTKMSNLVGVDLSRAAAPLGVLAVRGPDAARFLQGQLSADVEQLASGASTLAGLHNPQGRVLALLALVRTAPEEFLVALPQELADRVAQHLRKYVLRARVRIEPAPTLRVFGTRAAPDDSGLACIAWGERHLLLAPAGREPDIDPDLDAWLRADLRAGLPQVYAATSESFVAQMLNLDLLGAISFDKGCYTGQEVIARAHYRGRVKRRLQRWRNPGDRMLAPGDSARGADGRPLSVVCVASGEAGGQELLAVGTFAAADEHGPATPTAGAPVSPPEVTLEGPLPLPYVLPD